MCDVGRNSNTMFLPPVQLSLSLSIVDVPVDLSKLANFLKWKVTTIVCFGTMAITWFYTRLYLLPIKIYYTSITKSHYVLEYGSVPVLLYVCYRHFFYIFLGLLILLHTAWFAMFVRMFITLVVKKEIHDYSEHKNGEPPTTQETKKKV
jgi:TLC domain